MSWLLSPIFFLQHEEWWWWIHRVVFSPGSICCVALIQQPSWFGCTKTTPCGCLQKFSIQRLAATQENISQLRLMYQALLDPPGGLDGAPCGSWRKKEEYCSHSGQAWKGTKEQRRTAKQVIDDLLYLDPWKMDHVKCCWLEFFLVLEDLWVEYTPSWPDITHTTTMIIMEFFHFGSQVVTTMWSRTWKQQKRATRDERSPSYRWQGSIPRVLVLPF